MGRYHTCLLAWGGGGRAIHDCERHQGRVGLGRALGLHAQPGRHSLRFFGRLWSWKRKRFPRVTFRRSPQVRRAAVQGGGRAAGARRSLAQRRAPNVRLAKNFRKPAHAVALWQAPELDEAPLHESMRKRARVAAGAQDLKNAQLPFTVTHRLRVARLGLAMNK